jgi:hypothetical protein
MVRASSISPIDWYIIGTKRKLEKMVTMENPVAT